MSLPALEPPSISVHLSEDTMEEYVMGIMPTADQAHLEYHALVCGECCEKLEKTFIVVEALEHLQRDAKSGTK